MRRSNRNVEYPIAKLILTPLVYTIIMYLILGIITVFFVVPFIKGLVL